MPRHILLVSINRWQQEPRPYKRTPPASASGPASPGQGTGGEAGGRPPALDQERILESQRIYAENPSIRCTARVMNVSQGTVKKALGLD